MDEVSGYAVGEEQVGCPYCGERVGVQVDAPAGRHEWVEDCAVCCRPMQVVVEVAPDGGVSLVVTHEDDA